MEVIKFSHKKTVPAKSVQITSMTLFSLRKNIYYTNWNYSEKFRRILYSPHETTHEPPLVRCWWMVDPRPRTLEPPQHRFTISYSVLHHTKVKTNTKHPSLQTSDFPPLLPPSGFWLLALELYADAEPICGYPKWYSK